MSISLAQVVGRNVRRLREAHDVKLEDIARSAQALGLRWNTARVSRIDRGEGNITLETALILALILTDVTATNVSLGALLESDEPIELAPRATLTVGTAQALARGDRIVTYRDGLVEGGEILEAGVLPIAQAHESYNEILRPVGVTPERTNALNEGRAAWSLADERNARKLGLSDAEFLAWSVRLWGRLMSQETEARAPEGATAQKKGRITRDLMDDLRQQLGADHGDH